MKKIQSYKKVGFTIALVAAFSAFADDVTLEPVTVIALRPVPGAFIWYDGPMGVAEPTAGNAWLAMHLQMVTSARKLVDVRCVAAGDLKRITSLSDADTRYLAAASVYTTIRTAGSALKSMVVGKAMNPLDGITYQAFKVTYADDGAEKWLIFPEPRASVKLFDTPLPDSLVRGDGVIKPSKFCGTGLG